MIPPFPMAVATTPERKDLSLENDRSERGQLDQRDAALGSTESRQTMGGTDITLGIICIYCGRGLENSVGDSEVGHLWSTIACAHGEYVHATCMLDRTERLACGHADPQPCVLCRSEWPAKAGLPIRQNWRRICPDHGRREVGGNVVAEVLEEDGPRLVPGSYVMTGSHPTSEHIVRTHERSPTSPFLLFSLFSDALGLPQEAYLNFTRARKLEVAAAHYRERLAVYAFKPRDILLQLPNRRLCIAPHFPRVSSKPPRRMGGTPYQVGPWGPT